MKNKRGATNAFVTLDDKSGRLEVQVFGELYDQVREKLRKDEIIFVRGAVEDDEFTGGKKMRASDVSTLEEIRMREVVKIRVEIIPAKLCRGFVDELARILEPFRPKNSIGCPVSVGIASKNSGGDVILGDSWRVTLHDDLLQKLKEHYGFEKVHLSYR